MEKEGFMDPSEELNLASAKAMRIGDNLIGIRSRLDNPKIPQGKREKLLFLQDYLARKQQSTLREAQDFHAFYSGLTGSE